MSTELIINASLPETRIALMEDGEIQDLVIERASGKGIVGNIYKGRVTRVLPGMQAAFVDIGLEKAAFLYVDDVYVHSHVWEDTAEDEETPAAAGGEGTDAASGGQSSHEASAPSGEADEASSASHEGHSHEGHSHDEASEHADAGDDAADDAHDEAHEAEFGGDVAEEDAEGDEGEDDEDQGVIGDPEEMGAEGEGGEGPSGTVGPGGGGGGAGGGEGGDGGDGARRKHRRGRRGGRFRKRRPGERADGTIIAGGEGAPVIEGESAEAGSDRPDTQDEQLVPVDLRGQIHDRSVDNSDRSEMSEKEAPAIPGDATTRGRDKDSRQQGVKQARQGRGKPREEFSQQRGRDKRVPAKATLGQPKGPVSIQDLLKEGQEVIVQVAKDPIATKGARLTCHISLPGRHLVCMPTIDHVGVSRRIERDEERRRLREFVEKNRPKKLGFIVRTASGRQSSAERSLKQDIDYLTHLWGEIRTRASEVTAPALIYEDLNSVLRAIRDWVTEEIDKIVVDSRYHYNDIQKFVSHFMPSLRQKVELYHGDLPIFDAYKISTELARALERKVWLKSGGYLVIDQAEALVAIDVNTGRFVGKKNLEDTILKTNLEAVQEIAYQLRLRNCGGIIILDLIDMEKEENKQRVYRALEEAIKKDRSRPSIMKISDLGLVEMTRKRTRDTIVRSLCESCAHCEGKGFVKSRVTVAYEILREIEREGIERDVTKVLVQANADVIDILAIEERDTVDQLERRYRKSIYLQAVGDFHPEQFEVSSDRVGGRKSAGPVVGRGSNRGVTGDRDRGRGRDRDRGGKDRNRDRERGDRDRGGDRERGGGGGGGGGGQIRTGGPRVVIPRPLSDGADSVALVPGATLDATQAPAGGENEGNDEDRLAFLRAQAAQDAALAKLGVAGQGAQPSAGRGGDRDRGGGGGGGERGGRGRRGRRGGKFRGGRDAQGPGDTRPPLGPQMGPLDGGGGGDGGGSSGSDGGSGGDSGGGDGDTGGGGDRSNPPA